jgi:hypothetical protein
MKRSSKSLKLDRAKRSAEGWERGDHARKIGNPRYTPKKVTGKDGVRRKVYCLRLKNLIKSKSRRY